MQPVAIIHVKYSGTTELERMQLHMEYLIFRWVRDGAPIIPSMKDSIDRVTGNVKLREYFWERLRPKFLTFNEQTTLDSFENIQYA